MTRFLKILLLAAFIFSMPVFAQEMPIEEFPVNSSRAQQISPEDYRVFIENDKGAIYEFEVELALDQATQEKGLMNREFMPKKRGMLFVFDNARKRSFWMKNTLIPLDIIFIAKDGEIEHIHSMAKPLDLSLITSGKPCVAVLEINGGIADQLGIKAGDKIYHPAFRNLNLLSR